MKNKLTDLNNHLFAELERLSDEDITDDQLDKELKRAKAVAAISAQVISNAQLALGATKLKAEYFGGDATTPLLEEILDDE